MLKALVQAILYFFGKYIFLAFIEVYKWIGHLIAVAFKFVVAFAQNHPIIFAIICIVLLIRLIIFIRDEF